nr:hypothetical protein [Tanacetum cinerariifolium]
MEYDIWAMKMEHYLSHTDYPIWQVIQNGNDTNGIIKVLPPKSAKEVVAKERERKARTTLLMALPEDHLEKFHKMADAKEMWEAIKSRFSGNDESKERQKYLLSNSLKVFLCLPQRVCIKGMIGFKEDLYIRMTQKLWLPLMVRILTRLDMLRNMLRTMILWLTLPALQVLTMRAKGNQDSRRRDAGYNGNKTRDNGRRPEYQDDSKALVTIDGEDIDWLGYGDYRYGSILTYKNEVLQSVFMNKASDLEDIPVNDRFADGMHAVPPLMTGNYMPSRPDVICEPKVWTDALIIEEYESYSHNDSMSNVQEDKEKPNFAFTDYVKHVKTSRENIKETCTTYHSPKIENHDRNGYTRKGLGYAFTRKACFVCGNSSHLIRDCNFYEKRMAKQAELTKSKNKVTGQRENRPVWNNVQKDNPYKALKDKGIIDSGCSKHITLSSNGMITGKGKDNPYKALKDKGIIDSGCSKHITLSSNGMITGKGKVKTSKLDFENVYYVEELKHYNLFAVSQMCDKKNKVLFTNTDCLVLSLDFKLLDENQKEKQHKASCKVNTMSSVNQPLQILNMDLFGPTSVRSINDKTYCLVITDVENQANNFAGPKEANNSVGTQANDDQGDKIENNTGFKTREKPVSQVEQIFLEELKKLKIQEKEANDAAESLRKEATHDIQNASTRNDPLMHYLKEIYANLSEGIFTDSSYDDEGMVTDFNNLETNESVSPTPTTRIHTIHPKTKILGDLKLAVQTRSKVNTNSKAHALHWKMKVRLMLCKRNYCSSIFRRQEEGIDYDEVFTPVVRIEAIRIFLDFTSYIGFIVYQIDMKSAFLYGIINEEVYVSQPPSFVDPKFPNKVYKIVKALYGLHQAHSTCVKTTSTLIETQKPLVKDEEADDVDVHLYTSMIGFLMYLTASRLDIMFAVCACSRFQVTPKTSHLHAVKRIFRYLKGQPKLGLWYLKVSSFDLEAYSDSDYAEVYVTQPPGFVDLKFPNKVYKVVKALYGLHQAPRAWYATLSTFLERSGYRIGAIDKTLFIKQDKKDIMLVQVYEGDIIFGSTKKSWCDEFEELMKNRFQMSSMGELTFFLGLQVKQKEDGIFISQDKSMIGSLMYLTASRPNNMFAVYACSRFQVTLKTSHLQAVKRIFRYLKGQPKFGLWYPKASSFDLKAYSDSDYAGVNLDRKSTTGATLVKGRLLEVTTAEQRKELASPKQTALGKDESNSLIVDNLLKIIWSSMHHVIAMKHWLFQGKRQL